MPQAILLQKIVQLNQLPHPSLLINYPLALATPSRQTDGSEQKSSKSPVDKFLILPTTTKKKGSVATSSTCAMSGARVLTSAECLAIIQEKERKKKQQEEEKENRKRLREEKKKQREKEKQKNAEQRMLEEKEREKQREKKAKDRVRKEERAKKSRTGATNKTTAGACPSTSGSKDSTPLQPKRILCECTNLSPAKRLRRDTQGADSNRCCVCLQTFEEEVELGFGA